MELKGLGSVAPYCKNGKSCLGYLIKEKEEKILLDCGNGITNYLNMEEDLENMTIIISHFHPDHYGDLSSIGEAIDLFLKFGFLNKRVKLYLPKVENSLIRHLGNTQFSVEKNKEEYEKERMNQRYVESIAYHHSFDVEEYDRGTKLQIGDMNIRFYQTLHPANTYAVRIESPTGKFAYSADTYYDESLIDFFQNANTLLCEASLLKGQARTCEHLYAYEAADLASKSKVDQLLLTHFWPEIAKERYVEEAKNYFENTQAIEEGKVYKLLK